MDEAQKFTAYYVSESYRAWRASIEAFIATLPSLELPNYALTAWLDANPPPAFV